jgi:peptide/nickel transport system ATP-binding protein
VSETDPLLSADGLWRSYRAKTARQTDSVEAVKDVSLQLAKSGSLAVVGRSGSGKSTLARLLLAIENPDRGTVRFMGRQLSHRPEREIRGLRRNLQAVFQDPGSSLNPCLRVGTIVAEPLAAHGIGSFDERRYRVREVLDQVGLDSGAELKYPDQFSGGERQRIAIARAMAPEPELVLLDEPVSSLDASVQRDVIALLRDLRRRYGLTILMISHDLDVVRDLCERVAVMHEGCFVETGPTEKILSSPEHPATRELVEAAGTHR